MVSNISDLTHDAFVSIFTKAQKADLDASELKAAKQFAESIVRERKQRK